MKPVTGCHVLEDHIIQSFENGGSYASAQHLPYNGFYDDFFFFPLKEDR